MECWAHSVVQDTFSRVTWPKFGLVYEAYGKRLERLVKFCELGLVVEYMVHSQLIVD